MLARSCSRRNWTFCLLLTAVFSLVWCSCASAETTLHQITAGIAEGICFAGIGGSGLLALVLMLLMTLKATATTYYVRTTGNDGNSGTSAGAAWKTFEEALDSTSPGDIVYFGAGTYTEDVEPSVDGSSGNPIRFVADTDGSQTGDAGAVILASKGGNPLKIEDDNYLEFEGIKIDGNGSGKEGIKVKNSVGIVLERCEIYDGSDGIKTEGTATVTAINCLFRDNSDDGIYVKEGTFTIWNCTVANNEGDGIQMDTGTVTITNSIFANNTDSGFFRDKGSLTHTYNLVYGNKDDFDGVSKHATELNVDPLFFNDNNFRLRFGSPALDEGISTGAPTDDIEGTARPINGDWDLGCYENDPDPDAFYGNIFYVRTDGDDNNDGTGPSAAEAWESVKEATENGAILPGDRIYVKAGTYNDRLQPTIDGSSGSPINYIADTTGSVDGWDAGDVILTASEKVIEFSTDDYYCFEGFTFLGFSGKEVIKIKDSDGIELHRCIIYEGKEGLHLEGTCDVLVTNCIIRDVDEEGVYVKDGNCVADIWNCTIVNNTNDGLEMDNGTVTVTNSIIANNGANGLLRDGGTLTHTYNIVYGNSTNFSSTSKHASEIVSDPLFTDEANDDYSLSVNSPALNAGTDATGTVDEDIDQLPRPVGSAWDIGAYEYPLIGYWLFDEGTGTTTANEVGSTDATLEGSPDWEAIRCANAIKLDGSSDWVDLKDHSISTDAYTVGAWFKTGRSSQQTIFAATADGTNDHALFVEIDAGVVKFTHRYPAASSGGTTVASTDLFNDGFWHQVVAVKTDTDMLLYVDGELVDQTSNSDSVTADLDLVVGREGLSLSSNYFKGSLDEVVLFGKALSGTEVSDLYGLVGYWKLDESSGSTAFDSSNYANDGTLVNTPTWDDDGGFVDGALSFNGSNEYVTMADPGLGTGSFSVSAWINVTDLSSANATWGMGIVRSTTGQNVGDFILAVDDDGSVHFSNWRSTGNDLNGCSYTSDGLVAQSTWVHVLATWDGVNNKIYVDGVEVGSLSTHSTDTGWGIEHSIGRSWTGSGYFFDGLIDDVRIYNHALCADEAEELYASGAGRGVRVIKWLEKK